MALLARVVVTAVAAAYTVSVFVRPVPGHSVFLDDWVYNVLFWAAAAVCLWGARRGPDPGPGVLLLAAAIGVYAIGNTTWVLWVTPMASPPYPSVADFFWLAFYPLGFPALGFMARGHVGKSFLIWIDGVIAALAVAAVGVLIALGPIGHNVTGSVAAIVVNMAYPVCDIGMLMLLITLTVASRRRPSPAWLILGLCLVGWAVTDTTYVLQVAAGTYHRGTILDAGWLIPAVGMAWIPWIPARTAQACSGAESSPARRPGIAVVLPAALTVICLGLLTWRAADESILFAVLAAGALTAGCLRLVLSVREVERLAHVEAEARTDPLTGLGNRRALTQCLADALDQAEPFNLYLLDLDGFKDVNDTLGHEAGDICLQVIARRMTDCLHGDDSLFRLGGDEFAVVAPLNASQGVELSERLLDQILRPMTIGDVTISVGASIGIITCPDQARTAGDALRFADVAMYNAKRKGLGCTFYDLELHATNQRRLALAVELRQGLNSGAFEVAYQPMIELASGEAQRLEALIRWRHPTLGLLLPDAFLDVAAEVGQQAALTRFVLDSTLAQQRLWLDQGLNLPVSINVAAADLEVGELVEMIEDALHRHSVPGSQLTVELTEKALIHDPDHSQAQLLRIRSLGVQVALDDFGTGFASLSHLRDLPLNQVKIDQAFVAALTSDPIARTVVEQTIQLAHRLGLRVIAEGVEDADLREELTRLGCQAAQGFLWSSALSADDVEGWIAQHNPAVALPLH